MDTILGVATNIWILALTALVLLGMVYILWRVPLDLTNAVSILNKFVTQFGSNGDLTLRAEMTAIGERVTSVHTQLTANQQAITQLQGLKADMEKEMEEAGLDARIRARIAESLEKKVATTISVIQAGAGATLAQVAAGTGVTQAETK